MHKKYPLLLLLSASAAWIGTSQQSIAQSFGDIGSLAADQKTGSNDVTAGTNLATGTIAPSVPLLVLPGTAGSAAIGLQYTAGAGVKVNDVASEVGLGWVLTGTGAITREVKGMPDDSERGWFVNRASAYNVLSYKSEVFANYGIWHEFLPIETAGDLVNYFKKEYTFQTQFGPRRIGANEQPYHLAWLYPASRIASFGQYTWGPNEPYYAGNPNPNVANNYAARYSGKWFPDNEPDVYTITLPTGKVQFVFTAAGVPVPLQDQTIKIQALNLGTRNPTNDGLLHEFKVTTADGVQYLFGSARGTNDYKESISVTSRTLEANPIPDKTNYSCIHKWLLKSVLYPSGEQTDYSYGLGKTYEFAINNYIQQDFVYSLTSNSQFSNLGPYMLDPTYWNFFTNRVIDRVKLNTWRRKYTTRTTVTSPDYKQLTAITNRQGRITLTYATTARQDIGGTTKALTGLQLYNQYGLLIKDLRLEQHYADAGQVVANAQPYDRYHLLLDKVIDRGTGCDYTAAYTFAYNAQAFCRNSALKDDWGYLNGTTYPSDDILVGSCTRGAPLEHTFNLSGRDRNPSLPLSQALILKSVASATGSTQEFTYELHDYYPIGTTGNSSIANRTIGGLRIKSVRVFDGVDHANDIVETYIYRKATSPSESSGCWGDSGQYAKMQMMHGNGRMFGEDPLPEEQLRAAVPFCIPSSNPNYSGLIDYYYILRSDASMYQYAADYIDYSCVTIDRGIKGKTQHELTSWADAARHDYVNEYTRQQANNLENCPDDPLHPSRRGNELSLPFSLKIDGLPLGYTDGISADFPQRSSRASERGLPTRIRQLNTAGLAVAENLYYYDFERSNTLLPTVTGVYIKPDMEVLGHSQYPRYFQLYYYNHDAKWIPLTETTEIVYDQQYPGNVAKRLVNTTLIEYSNFNPSKITKFAGVSPRSNTTTAYVTEIRRPLDFATGSTPASADQVTTPALLRAAGMTATTVEQEEYQLTPSGTKIHQQARLFEFQLINGRVLPYRSYVTKAGLTTFNPAYTSQVTGNSWAFNSDINYLLTATMSGYTAEGLPANTIGRSGVAQATIWGYGRTIPIAMIQNGRVATGTIGAAAWSTAGHTSFEENGTDSDRWSLPNQFAADAKTGSRSAHYVRSQGEYGFNKALLIPAGEDRRSKLVFSCWAKVPVGSASSTNFCLVASSPAPQSGYSQDCLTISPGQDWKYFETIIDLADSKWNSALTTDQDLNLLVYLWMPWGSELLVDEVRIHRADATMETATYLPFVGRTSATSQNGTTSYLTYDANYSPRLQLNHKRDIMQRVRKHLVGEPGRPTAEFILPEKVPANCSATMVAEYGSCAAGTTFTWEFGDGRTAVNSTPTQSIQYAQPGTYQVALTVTSQERGTSRVSKSITILDPLHTEMDVQGSTYVDLCETSSPEPVIMTAHVLANCQGITYRWQSRQGGQAWSDLGVTSNTYTRPVMNGTTFIRCIVGLAGGADNSNSPGLQEITITGYYPNQQNQPGGPVLECPVANK